jgi:hypothetical protein
MGQRVCLFQAPAAIFSAEGRADSFHRPRSEPAARRSRRQRRGLSAPRPRNSRPKCSAPFTAMDYRRRQSGSEVIGRVRALAKKTSLEKLLLDVSDIVRETMPLVAARVDQPLGIVANGVGTGSGPW